MKKAMLITGLIMAPMIGMASYIMMNKKTKANADKLINTALNELDTSLSKMNK